MNFMKKSIALAMFAAVGMGAIPMDAGAAIGGSRVSSSGGVGISRSAVVRPSAPAKTYSTPSSSSRAYSSSQPRVVERHYYNNSTPNYSNNNSSFGRDVASTALGVGAGMLAAEAISNLVAGPNGTYTHPAHPGTVYNAQGVPQNVVAAPVQQAQQPVVQMQPIVVQESSGGFFSFLWGSLGNILHLALFLGVVGALSYASWKLFKLLKRKKETLMIDLDDLKDDIDYKAQDLFYNLQKNSDNVKWLEQNIKYMNPDDLLSPPSRVVSYEHDVVDVSVEAGKIRATVLYKASLQEVGSSILEYVHQYWHYERDGNRWVLVGIEVA